MIDGTVCLRDNSIFYMIIIIIIMIVIIIIIIFTQILEMKEFKKCMGIEYDDVKGALGNWTV